MIVVHTEDESLRLITQPAHAAGAGQLAAHWHRPTAMPAPLWPRFLEAVRRHDDGWWQLEHSPAVDEQGRPHTFKTLPTPTHVQVWRSGINELAGEDPYAGLLLALHARWLYTRIGRNEAPEGESAAREFIDWLDQRIDGLMQRMKTGDGEPQATIEPHALDIARRLLGFLDMLSLVLLGALSINDWPEPLPFGDRCEALRLAIDHDRVMSITPWPFDSDEVTVTFEAREMDQGIFDSAEALGETLWQTPARHIAYTLRRKN